MERELKEEREKRADLERQVGELRKREAWKAEVGQRKRECEAGLEQLRRESLSVRTESLAQLEGQVVELKAAMRGGSEKRAAVESKADEPERGDNPTEDEQEAEKLPEHSSPPGENQGSDRTEQQPEGTSDGLRASGVTGRLPERGEGTAEGEDEAERRMVWVVGSSNVTRCKAAVIKGVGYDQRVQVVAMPGKCFSEVMEEAKDRMWANMKGRNLVVVHAGVNDVLNGKGRYLGKQIEAGVKKLRTLSEGVHIVLCTIPEVRGRGPEIERQVVEANALIRQMKETLRYDVMDVNQEVYGTGALHPFSWDGIHYSTPTGWQVGSRMGRRARAFLRASRFPKKALQEQA